MENKKIDESVVSSHVPLMEELSDDKLKEMMGGGRPGCGRVCSLTCECGCWVCTSTIYGCTRAGPK